MIPEFITELARKATAETGRLFIVGGAPRDLLLNKRPRDFDLALTPSVDLKSLVNTFDGEIIHTYTAGNHPCHIIHFPDHGIFEVSIIEYLYKDALSRDFTINALYLEFKTGNWIYLDPLGIGVSDLHAGKLRLCKNSAFIDDIRRVIRAAYLSSVLELDTSPAFGFRPMRKASLVDIQGKHAWAIGMRKWSHRATKPSIGLFFLRDVELPWSIFNHPSFLAICTAVDAAVIGTREGDDRFFAIFKAISTVTGNEETVAWAKAIGAPSVKVKRYIEDGVKLWSKGN